MNVTDLKAKYHSFLSTPKGKKQLLLAVALKRQWVQMKKETDIQIDTAGVKLNVINPNLAKKIKKIDITPIGLNNMCHSTSQFFCDDENGITSKLGFNLTACPCGKMMSYEIHSVNKIGETLYDFTKDFNEEASKYFLEIDGNIDANTYIEYFGRDPIGVNRGCKCPIRWNNGTEYIKTETYLLNHINQLETISIHTY
jgi:hypothetical protein